MTLCRSIPPQPYQLSFLLETYFFCSHFKMFYSPLGQKMRSCAHLSEMSAILQEILMILQQEEERSFGRYYNCFHSPYMVGHSNTSWSVVGYSREFRFCYYFHISIRQQQVIFVLTEHGHFIQLYLSLLEGLNTIIMREQSLPFDLSSLWQVGVFLYNVILFKSISNNLHFEFTVGVGAATMEDGVGMRFRLAKAVKFKNGGLHPGKRALGHRTIIQSKGYIRLIMAYIIIQITKSSRPYMSLVHIVPALSDLFTSKRITFQSLRPLIFSNPRSNNHSNIRQQLCIVSSFAYFLHQALQHELFLVEKFKHEVFYAMLQYQPARRSKSDGPGKKHHHDRKVVRVRKADITINEILELAVFDGLALSKTPQTSLVVGRDSNPASDNNLVTLPPFDANTIAELTQSITQPSESQLEPLTWEPNKLESYQRWLALTQRGIEISNVPQRLPKTKKKNPTKQEVAGPDHKIIVSQGQLNASILEKLATKAKASKNSSNLLKKSFFACLDALHQKLSDSDRLIFLLKKKEKLFVKKPSFTMFEGNFMREMIDSPERVQLRSKDKSINSSFESKEQLDQRIVSKVLEAIFLKSATSSFDDLCKNCPTMTKADVFHELLHLDFPIQQLDPAGFGQIKISRK